MTTPKPKQEQQPPGAAEASKPETNVSRRLAGDRSAPRRYTMNEEIALRSGQQIIWADTELQEWDMAEYKKDSRLFLILGKRNTGKTVFALNWCYQNRNLYPYGMVITATKFNHFWEQYFPSYLVVDKFRPQDIEMIFRAQQARVTQHGVNSRFLLLIDDMASDTALRYSELLTTIAYNGRHYNLDVLYLTQVRSEARRRMPSALTRFHSRTNRMWSKRRLRCGAMLTSSAY